MMRTETTTLTADVADELDVFECSLDGVNQIEASAGTGKTWNICALYVRLLLEKKLAADAILVVTFTKAATAELHERIRSRLVQIAHAMETGDTAGDAFLERLFETTLERVDPDEALKRIRIALHTFDQAAIHTIHAFCQRALQEAPFAATMPFAFELEADDSALRFEMAADFWRERVEPAAARDPSFAAWLVSKGAGPASLDAQLSRRLKKPLATLRWGEIGARRPRGRAGVVRYGLRALACRARRHRAIADRRRSEAQQDHAQAHADRRRDCRMVRLFRRQRLSRGAAERSAEAHRERVEERHEGEERAARACCSSITPRRSLPPLLPRKRRSARHGLASCASGSTTRRSNWRCASGRGAWCRSTICCRTCIRRSTPIRGSPMRCGHVIRLR